MTKKIGLIFADTMEFAPFEKYAASIGGEARRFCGMNAMACQLQHDDSTIEILAVECGIGKACAAGAAGALIAGFGADAVINAGLSGAVSGCRRGDIVVGESYAECDMNLTAIGYKQGEKPGFPIIYNADAALLKYAGELNIDSVRLGTGDIFLTDSSLKDAYRKAFEISAFDMESAAIACVCCRAEVPFISIRKISDDADDAAKEDYREMNQKAETSLTEMLEQIFNLII